jgi:adhesin transport system outer membrane protein
MKFNRAITTVAGLLASVALVVQPALAETLSLAQAVERGIVRSPELGQAQARREGAEAVRDQATRSWFPTVDVTAAGGLRHLENDARVQLGLSAIDERPLYGIISVSQPVLDFGRRGNGIRSGKARVAAAEWNQRFAAEASALLVAQSYLQVYIQSQVAAAAEANLAFHRDLVADVDEGVQKGALSISELQQAKERQQSAQSAADQARNELSIAQSELALLLGTSDVAVTTPPDPSAAIPATLDAALAIAQTNDPRLRGAEQAWKASQFSADRARAEYWPTIGLQGTVKAGSDFEGYRGTTRDYEVQVVLRWTPFNGGVTAARVREVDAQAKEAGFSYVQAQRESELAVRKGWIAMENWRTRAQTQSQRVDIARGLLDSYRAQFGIGRRSLLDVLDAQNAVFNATVEAETAKIGLILAQYGLLAQVGQLTSFLGASSPAVDPNLYGPR